MTNSNIMTNLQNQTQHNDKFRHNGKPLLTNLDIMTNLPTRSIIHINVLKFVSETQCHNFLNKNPPSFGQKLSSSRWDLKPLPLESNSCFAWVLLFPMIKTFVIWEGVQNVKSLGIHPNNSVQVFIKAIL